MIKSSVAHDRHLLHIMLEESLYLFILCIYNYGEGSHRPESKDTNSLTSD